MKHKRKREDYLFCNDCNMFVDFWKYDYDLDDSGHADCQNVRLATTEELAELETECEGCGCHEEEILGNAGRTSK